VIKTVLAVLVAVLGLAASAAAQAPTAFSSEAERWYGKAEYLLWWTKDSPQPTPLVTNGLLGAPNTSIIMGGRDVDLGPRQGGRVTLGAWITPDRVWGVELGGFYLPEVADRRSVFGPATGGAPDLVVPFLSTTRNAESFSFLSQSGAFSGLATQHLTSLLWGAEASAVFGVVRPGPWTLDLLFGPRYLRLSEGFSFTTNSPDLPPGSTTVFTTKDVFDARNDFYGGQLGARARFSEGRWSAEATLKVALGAMRQRVDIEGSFVTNLFNPAGLQAFPGGIFAQPTNIGSHQRHVFAVIPEIGLNAGFKVVDGISIVVGYNFMYINSVVRPGNQVDRAINTTQATAISLTTPSFSGAARPEFKFKDTDFWAHGLTAGFAFNF
jgi:hypothetical protein